MKMEVIVVFDILFIVVMAYLLGSIPFGVILTRWAGRGDLRSFGSGNIGVSNVLRLGGYGLAAATLFLDALKAYVVILIVDRFYGPDEGAIMIAALAVIVGHIYPVWLRFRGGKGVAPWLGVVVALSWPSAGVFIVSWLVVMGLSGYASLASLIACFLSLMAVLIMLSWPIASILGLSAIVVLIVYAHRDNIARLRAGEEIPLRRRR